MQIGSMGGIAVTMSLRLDESSGALPHVPVLMLLDRTVDLHLARRSGAEGWLIKPLDSLRLKRAVNAILAGESYTEGVPVVAVLADESESETDDAVDLAENDAESTEEETVNAG
jgi:DNA-binding NarL/FixJ family response regulator